MRYQLKKYSIRTEADQFLRVIRWSRMRLRAKAVSLLSVRDGLQEAHYNSIGV